MGRLEAPGGERIASNPRLGSAAVLRKRADVWTPPPYRVPSSTQDPDYGPARRRTIEDAIGNRDLLARFRAGASLPEAYGAGLDERVVEYPWLMAHQRGGPALDAGSTLNHDFVLDRFLPALAPLHITTLRPEASAFHERGVSYVYADLRDLPLRHRRFSTVVCVSTLEHIGMDNSRYGVGTGRADDPDAELARALSELVRVAAPGAAILITVPYGRAEDHGWFRQLDRAGVNAIASGLGGATVTVYTSTPTGWQVSDLASAADASYGDRVPAAAAVACIRGDGPA
jgi:Methyltransferase domain